MNKTKLRVQRERLDDIQLALMKFGKAADDDTLRVALKKTADIIGNASECVDKCITMDKSLDIVRGLEIQLRKPTEEEGDDD